MNVCIHILLNIPQIKDNQMCEPFIMYQFLFPMFCSAAMCLPTFLLKNNYFFLTWDAIQLLLKLIPLKYLFEVPENSHQNRLKTGPGPGPEIKRTPKRPTPWKNWTSRTKNVAMLLKTCERQCRSDSFSYKKQGCLRPRFRANNVWKLHPIFLFQKLRNCYKKDDCQFVALISMKRCCRFTHFYAASF